MQSLQARMVVYQERRAGMEEMPVPECEWVYGFADPQICLAHHRMAQRPWSHAFVPWSELGGEAIEVRVVQTGSARESILLLYPPESAGGIFDDTIPSPSPPPNFAVFFWLWLCLCLTSRLHQSVLLIAAVHPSTGTPYRSLSQEPHYRPPSSENRRSLVPWCYSRCNSVGNNNVVLPPTVRHSQLMPSHSQISLIEPNITP